MPSLPDNDQAIQEELLAHALTATATAIFITDRTGRIVWINDAFSQLCGYRREEVIGRTPSLLKSGRQSHAFYTQLWETMLSGKVWQGEVVDQRQDGSLYTADEIITPLFDEHGAITHFIAIQHDVTERKQESEHNHQLAYQDFLTALPNRANFSSCHEQAVAQAKQTRHLVGTLFLDLDKFKPVNDRLGHRAGDELLVAVARRMRSAVRHGDLVARVGGDEFAILLTELPNVDVARLLAQKLVDSIARPFLVQDKKVSIGASIGIAIYPIDGEEPDALLEHADKAMYRAKCLGGSNYQFYTPEPDSARPVESREKSR
jgi:diguanylate cyclase (GGDEF)-like protein/PAS domain S-box-containing protein